MNRVFSMILLEAILLTMGSVSVAAEKQLPVRNDVNGAVLHLLTSINWEADERQWRQTGGVGVKAILEQYLMDENRPETTRMRALHTLRYFAPKAFIVQFTQARYPVELRRMAVRSLGEKWGAEALAELRGLSADKEPLVRDAVAATLAFITSKKAVELLENMAGVEQHPVVADTIGQALRYHRKQAASAGGYAP